MSRLIQLIEEVKIPNNTMMTVIVDGDRYLVAHTNDIFYVANDACTHAECSLGTEGFLEGNSITCGCHGAVFNLTNGHATLPATKNLMLYNPVVRQNGYICIYKN